MSDTPTLDETPARILADYPLLDLRQTAIVLRQHVTRGEHKGEPNVRRIKELIAAGRIRLIDPEAPAAMWAVSRMSILEYLGLDQQQGSAA